MEGDEPQLSSSTLDALTSFLRERDEQTARFEKLQRQAETEHQQRAEVAITDFEENWQMSQFWYSDETAEALSEELLRGVEAGETVGIVSAPSVFVKIQQLKAAGKIAPEIRVQLLEYDQRFAIFDEFVPYDFQSPLRLPLDLKGKFTRVLVDPPFLSEDCQTKAALTVRWLTKPWTAPTPPTESVSSDQQVTGPATINGAGVQIILCTGERVGALVKRLYRPAGLKETTFEVRHSKGLSNEFRCYSTFASKRFKFKSDTSD